MSHHCLAGGRACGQRTGVQLQQQQKLAADASWLLPPAAVQHLLFPGNPFSLSAYPLSLTTSSHPPKQPALPHPRLLLSCLSCAAVPFAAAGAPRRRWRRWRQQAPWRHPEIWRGRLQSRSRWWWRQGPGPVCWQGAGPWRTGSWTGQERQAQVSSRPRQGDGRILVSSPTCARCSKPLDTCTHSYERSHTASKCALCLAQALGALNTGRYRQAACRRVQLSNLEKSYESLVNPLNHCVSCCSQHTSRMAWQGRH